MLIRSDGMKMVSRPMVIDIAVEAKNLDRFSFIATFVARCTAKKTNRQLTAGLYVKKTRKGWVYRSDVADLCEPCDAAKLFDLIRRTELGFYVKQAEDFRIEVFSS